jgi:hypothetical protein
MIKYDFKAFSDIGISNPVPKNGEREWIGGKTAGTTVYRTIEKSGT